jgi:integrase
VIDEVAHVDGKTKDAVAQKLIGLRTDVSLGRGVGSDRTPLSAYLNEWLATVRLGLRPTTAARYNDVVRKHIVPAIGSVKLHALRPLQIQRLYARVQEDLSAGTARKVHVVLHKALEDARRWRLIPTNPAADVLAPRAAAEERRIWTRHEIRRFVAVCKEGDPYYADLWLFLIGSGCRLGEALGLCWHHVDRASGAIRIERTVSFVNGMPVEGGPKTRAGRRTLVLTSFAAALERLHARREPIDGVEAGAAVFRNLNGKVPSNPNLRRSFASACRLADVPVIRIHDLRHVHASLSVWSGVDPKTVQKRLGHASLNMTLGIYSHALAEADQHLAAKLDGMVAVTTSDDGAVAASAQRG